MTKIGDKEEFDMCLAVREWEAEAKRIGREESQRVIVINMIRRGYTDQEIVLIAECGREYVAKVKRAIQ